MKTKLFRAGALAVAALGLALQAAAARAECKRYPVMASGVPVNFLQEKQGGPSAEETAQAAWEHLVAWQYGKQFADWKKAERGKVECRLLNRSYQQCTAMAWPCDGRED